jgi:hypothetical protein
MKTRTEAEKKLAQAQLAPRPSEYNWRTPISEWAQVEAEMILHEAEERGGQCLALVPKEMAPKKAREL